MDIIGRQSLRQTWDDLAEQYGEKTALIVEDVAGHTQQYSYRELNDEINRAANLFTLQGVVKGDRVAVHLRNCAEFILCWFGLAKIGAIVVPVNAHYLKNECSYLLQKCGVRTVVTEPEYLHIYEELADEEDCPLAYIMLARCHDGEIFEGTLNFNQLLHQQSAILMSDVPLSAEDTAEILFTSGTTSRPKGVVITHYNLRFAGYYTAWQAAIRSDDVYLTVMPAFHIDCQCTAAMAAFSAGATFVLLEKYSARKFWNQICKYRATITECIPLMVRTLMLQPRTPWEQNHCLREVFFYLTLSDQEKQAFLDRYKVKFLTSYGMTETIVGIIGDRPGDKRRWPSIGRTGLCYEAKITDSEGNPVPYGEVGEIRIKGEPGKTIFKEYYRDPEATAKALSCDGWLRTGDAGYMDEEGFFYFVDRNINMIKRCGENVSCVEIENVISAHPKIFEAAVVGVEDSMCCQAIKAFVIPKEGVKVTEAELMAYCEAHLARFKVPSSIEIRKTFARTSTGKVQKHFLCGMN
ncbi:crotonobetaine/carnitine-CoA ligase [Shewanella sp. GXUN23E]|uniref:crotonobetaine/carnitine-CoA ligase n=1 Tax=Shewanella sp. GXUN23E TaxID=3422498 RepID=UPI003D7C51BD